MARAQLDREVATRSDKRLANRLAAARLRFGDACTEKTSTLQPIAGSSAAALQRLRKASGARHEHIIITGPTGTGKNWLGCAFGCQAARPGYSSRYVGMPCMFENLGLARLDGRFPQLIDKLTRVQLLILDDGGSHSLTEQQRSDLLEIFEERYKRKQTLITAQLPVPQWHELIGQPTIVDAIPDCLVHNACRITLEGDSKRKTRTTPLLIESDRGEIIAA